LPVKRRLRNADRNLVSLSPRVRILAAAGVLAVLALAAGFLLLGGGSSSSAAVKQIKPLHPVKKHKAPATTPKTTAPKATAKKKVAAKVAVKQPSVIDGMPASLALALRSHSVVVVSLYTPGASVDRMATDEARHGAAVARAGFVALSVADEKIVAPLSSLLTGASTPADRVLDGPAVLVFVRPNSLFVRFNGFADRDTVAQAAANAATLTR
jgi:hypothetical protein